MNGTGCGQLDNVAAELALGLLDGEQRAEALAHVEQCGLCQAAVASLTELGEQLLLLAPEIPPPHGFESRVLARLGEVEPVSERAIEAAPARRRRRWVRPVLAAAAALVLVVGAVGARAAWQDADPDETTVSMMSGSGRVVGEVTLWHSDPAVIEMDVAVWVEKVKEAGKWPEGRWWLAVDGRGGDHHVFPLSVEDSPATVRLVKGGDEIGAGEVASVAVLDDTGKVWCMAQFR